MPASPPARHRACLDELCPCSQPCGSHEGRVPNTNSAAPVQAGKDRATPDSCIPGAAGRMEADFAPKQGHPRLSPLFQQPWQLDARGGRTAMTLQPAAQAPLLRLDSRKVIQCLRPEGVPGCRPFHAEPGTESHSTGQLPLGLLLYHLTFLHPPAPQFFFQGCRTSQCCSMKRRLNRLGRGTMSAKPGCSAECLAPSTGGLLVIGAQKWWMPFSG